MSFASHLLPIFVPYLPMFAPQFQNAFDANGNHVLIFCRFNRKKMTLAQKRARVAQKKAAFLKKMENDEEEED